MDHTHKGRLTAFVDWVRQYIRGDEKGEAQVFLDRLFQGFGHKGVKEAGATLEERVKKSDEGGTAFADLVWKPVVLIEMKKRGADLRKHYRQAFDYWTRLVPDRPRYVVLCNFDQFWIYDFQNQMDTPVDQVALADLPDRSGPLAFLNVTPQTPVFGNNQEAVTREAADKLATCFKKLMVRRVDRGLAQRFILQTLVALFAEDIGLLEEYFVTRLLAECKKPSDAFDLMGGLFKAMNTPGGVHGGRFKGVQYFNGGLFAEPAAIELYDDELAQLRRAAESRWSKVRPEIFGTLFEQSLDVEERHAYGAHFTNHADIMKIVGPTIVEPWRNLIENASSAKRLRELLERMRTYRVLDPACGSGNFLYLAYRELKRLEMRTYERLVEMSSKAAGQAQKQLGFVTASQFYGIDINPFAVELAKVTMMIAHKLAIDELQVEERALPLDNLDQNFLVADALVTSKGLPSAWPKADVIIGNPPFLGAKLLKPERGVDYVNSVRRMFPEVPGMADYCVYWIRKAHDHLPVCKPDDPVAGRAGLVGTQNIRNNKSRVGGLDYVVKTGTIVEAVDNQPWSGEANVHVSIVNWVKHAPVSSQYTARERRTVEEKLLVPEERRFWFKVQPEAGMVRRTGGGLVAKEYELAFRMVRHINSALAIGADVSQAKVLAANEMDGAVCQGVTPGHSGFVLTEGEAAELLRRDRQSRDVVYPYLIGRELVGGTGKPQRWIIDFGERNLIDARGYKDAFRHVEKKVLPDVRAKATAESGKDKSRRDQLERWWRHWRARTELMNRIARLSRYMVCSRVTKRPIFVFVSSRIRPGDAVQAFSLDDDYSFGILQSNMHWQWFVAKCSKLTERFRYTPESVFDTFPWPQAPSAGRVNAVASAAREVRRVRASALGKITGGLRAVYRTLELPGKNPLKDAHAALDAAVLAAYGFAPGGDILAQLLALNLDVAGKIKANEPVTPPGVPPGYPKPADLVTDDCVRAE